jgi:hypothetical protein
MNTHRTVTSGHVRPPDRQSDCTGVLSATAVGRHGSAGGQARRSKELLAAPAHVRLRNAMAVPPPLQLAEQDVKGKAGLTFWISPFDGLPTTIPSTV